MRLPLPLAVFLVVLALWGGWALGVRRNDGSAKVDDGDRIDSSLIEDQSSAAIHGTATISGSTDELDQVITVDERSGDDTRAGIGHSHKQFWAAVLAITAIGLTVMMFTSGGAIPPRMDHTVADVLHALPQGVCILDNQGKILMVNIAASRLMGRTPVALLGRSVSSLAWLGNRDHRIGDPWHLAANSPLPVATQWMRFQCKDGPVRTLAVNATTCAHPPDPRTFRTSSRKPNIVLTIQDVTEVERRAEDREKMVAILKQDGVNVRRHNRKLQHLASIDPLTGCLNRRRFFECFEKVWRNESIHRRGISVLMVDNDKFKHLNDQYGHGVGDDVLRQVSNWLQKALPEPALVCRYGGEEFCVLLPDCDHNNGMEIAEVLRQGVEAIRVDDHPDLRVSVSIGVATTKGKRESDAQTPVQMIALADRRLYEAKNGGRNQVVGRLKRSTPDTSSRVV